MKLVRSLALFVVSLVASASASAQCFQPDMLDNPGAGCSAAQTSVQQRAFQQQSLGLCWQNCALTSQTLVSVIFGPLNPMVVNMTPPQSSCAWYRARVWVLVGNTVTWTGQLHFTYARTWLETPMPGQFVQVWRYLINGDLRRVATGAFGCGDPSCVNSFGQNARFTGYIDYALDCQSNITERAWMLTHACDVIDHAPGFPRAGTFHPTDEYTFVGPAAGFVAGATGQVEAGTMAAESIRAWDATVLPARCHIEEPLVQASITASQMLCLCGTGPANWFEGQLVAFGGFGGMVVPFPNSDPFRSFPIGMWTNPSVFPGVEELRWNCNEALYVDCQLPTRQDYYFGVTTNGGFQAYSMPTSTPSVPLGQMFIDQANSAVLPGTATTRNRPYRSDRILNLNL